MISPFVMLPLRLALDKAFGRFWLIVGGWLLLTGASSAQTVQSAPSLSLHVRDRVLHISKERRMPSIDAQAAVKGISQELLSSATFYWRAVISYNTRQAPVNGRPGPIQLPNAEFGAQTQNSTAPRDLLAHAVVAGKNSPGYLAGGVLSLEVKVVLPDGHELRTTASNLRVVGDNPDPATVYEVLKNGAAPRVQPWLLAIACHESLDKLWQFNPWREDAPTNETQFIYPGEPFMNRWPGDGGVGIMQITLRRNGVPLKERPFVEDYWDWSHNVETGRDEFLEDYAAASRWHERIKKYPKFKEIEERTITGERMRIIVPGLGDYPIEDVDGRERSLSDVDPVLESAARRYNGAVGTHKALGTPLQEFVPKTEVDNLRQGTVFVTKDVGTDTDGTRIARIVWRRAQPLERYNVASPNESTADYVQELRKRVKKGACR
jgi:hypothetical protein